MQKSLLSHCDFGLGLDLKIYTNDENNLGRLYFQYERSDAGPIQEYGAMVSARF